MTKTQELGVKPIGVLLAQYSIPAVIAMLVNAIYNVVDRIFIGKLAGESALAGLTISFPVMMIIFAFASLIGAGGAALISIKLGEKDERGASHVFGNTISFGLIMTAIMLIVIFLSLNNLLTLFGASGEVLVHAATYLRIIIAGFIFQMLSFILSNTVRTEGQPILSMVAMVLSAVTNIILDYVFIGIFDMGVAGAAYATIAGQSAGLILLLIYYLRGKSHLKLKLKDFIPDFKVIINIISIGFSTFISTMGTSVSMAILNISLSKYGGTAAITSMGAINSLYTFFIMPIMGITQGMQPIIGYNHGANNQRRVSKTLKLAMLVGIIFSTAVFLFLQLSPEFFISLFVNKGSNTINVAVNGLRIYILMLPALSINLLGIAYYQATARGKASIILGVLRQFVFLIPVVLVLPGMIGLNGVWLATPIADGLAIIVTVLALIKSNKINKKSPDVKEAIA